MEIKTAQQAFRLLEDTDPEKIALAVEDYIAVTTDPGLSAAIRTTSDPVGLYHGAKPRNEILTVKLLPSVILEITGSLVQPGNITLPNPALRGRQTPEGTLGIKHLIRSSVTDQVTRMLCDTHGVHRSQHLHWCVSDILGSWTKKMPRALSARIRGATRYAQMEDAVRALL